MVPGASGCGVCPPAVVATADMVVSAGGLAALLVVPSGAVGLSAGPGGSVGVACVLTGTGGGALEAMVCRIQPVSLVMRTYTPGLLACAQPMPQLTMPAR